MNAQHQSSIINLALCMDIHEAVLPSRGTRTCLLVGDGHGNLEPRTISFLPSGH